MTMIHISIDHDESNSLAAYRGVVLRKNGKEVARRATGKPIVDWWLALQDALARGDRMILSPSVDHFLHDVAGYRMIAWHGVEVMVGDPRDRALDAVETDWTDNLSAGLSPLSAGPDGQVGSWTET